MPNIDVNGLSIAYEESGNPAGHPVVLIMGLGMQLVAWPDEFLAGLEEKGYRVIRFDNRDIGLSTKFDHAGKVNLKTLMLKALVGYKGRVPYTLGDMATDTLGLMDALGIGRAAIIGVSMGGMIAQILAARHPERVSRLVSIMSTTGDRSLPAATREATAALTSRPPADADLEGVIAHMVNVGRVIGSPGFPFDPERARKRILAALSRSTHPYGMPRQMAAIIASGSRTEMLKKVQAPTLVLHGDKDPLVRVEGGIHTAECIPGAKLKIIPGMGHDMVLGVIPLLLEPILEHLEGAA